MRIGDEHVVQPRLISITQSTELGTVYPPEAVAALAEWAHAHGMLLHVDGARLSNAAAGLGVSLRALTTDAGVDAVSFGGTKNGLMGAEAVVLLRDDVGDGFKYRRKQAMQLASKMRYISAQLDALLSGDLWERSAAHANAMARRLAAAVRDLPGVRVTQPVEANAVFAVLDPAVTERLQQSWPFYVWDEGTGEVRWMASWDTERGGGRRLRGRHPRRAQRDRDRRAGDVDLRAVGVQVDEQPAGPPHVLALEDRHRGGRLDEPALAQVGAERGGRGAGGRVLDHAARRERVARVEAQRRPRARRAGSSSSRARP